MQHVSANAIGGFEDHGTVERQVSPGTVYTAGKDVVAGPFFYFMVVVITE